MSLVIAWHQPLFKEPSTFSGLAAWGSQSTVLPTACSFQRNLSGTTPWLPQHLYSLPQPPTLSVQIKKLWYSRTQRLYITTTLKTRYKRNFSLNKLREEGKRRVCCRLSLDLEKPSGNHHPVSGEEVASFRAGVNDNSRAWAYYKKPVSQF